MLQDTGSPQEAKHTDCMCHPLGSSLMLYETSLFSVLSFSLQPQMHLNQIHLEAENSSTP